MDNEGLLQQYVNLIVEKKIREADLTDGSKTSFGSTKHIKDLESRLEDLTAWRDRQRKGSEARANYARLIGKLRSELASAKRALAKKSEKAKK